MKQTVVPFTMTTKEEEMKSNAAPAFSFGGAKKEEEKKPAFSFGGAKKEEKPAQKRERSRSRSDDSD